MAKNSEMPLSKAQAQKAIAWLRLNFGDKIENAVTGTPFSANDILAIACQETAYSWINWIDKMKPEDVLKYCIFDASGDVPDSSRAAFPKNKAAMLAVYPKSFVNMLIAEANKMRAVKGWGAREFLYKGYGIFQYDLQ